MLLVEDDPDYAQLVTMLLEETGTRLIVDHVSTWQDAVRALSGPALTAHGAASPPRHDVLLLDLRLPDVQGSDTLEVAVRSGVELPIVVLTGVNDSGVALEAIQSGAQDFLHKDDVTAAGLLRTLLNSVDRHRLREQIARVAARAQASEENFRNLIAENRDGMVVLDDDQTVRFSNPAARRMLGDRLAAPGTILRLPFSDDQDGLIQLSDDDGGSVDALVRSTPLCWEGAPARLVSLHDVTAIKESARRQERLTRLLEARNSRLRLLSEVDPLTGLLNRRGLERARAAEAHRPGGGALAGVLIDCDDFKRVNDALGHTGGDRVLAELTRRLATCLRPDDHLARVGGDEFYALLANTDIKQAAIVGERIRQAIAEAPIVCDAIMMPVTVSVGVARIPPGITDVTEMIGRTQHALRECKNGGKNRVAIHGLRRVATSERIQLERLLARRDQLHVVRQPVIDLRDGRLVGYELLSRGPQGPLRSPDKLFRSCAENGLRTHADIACLQRCLGAIERTSPLTWHVNVFPSTLLEAPIAELLATAPGVGPRICVELSEQQFVGEPSCLLETIDGLRERGYQIALDDVGFGRSSVETLVTLAPDVIKIDRRLVTGAHADATRRARLERMIGVARALGAEVIAEGVETAADVELLRQLGVEYAQGYHLGRPQVA